MLYGAAFAVLFRYADFITVLGGAEWHLGWIAGIGMIGSLLVRLLLGSCIDQYGARLVWVSSLLLYAAVCLAHLWIFSYAGVAIYLLRIAFCSAWAGVFGASLTFASKQAPLHRMAEFYGMLGTATFVGYLVGTQLSDLLMGFGSLDRATVNQLFVAAGVLSLLAVPFAWMATRGETSPRTAVPESAWRLLRKYHPLATFSVGAAMGMASGIANTFLRPYVEQFGISRIALFFSISGIATVGVRVFTRRWPERLGNHAVVLIGAAAMAVSQLSFLLVRAEWHLILPAFLFGGSLAILFPAVTAAGSIVYPAHCRGLATTLMLGVSDLGQLIGSPLAGTILTHSARVGLAPYPTLFVVVALVLATTGGVFAYVHRDSPATPAEE